MKLFSFLILLIFVSSSYAQPVCVSYYAAAAFTPKQCTAALKVFDGVKTPCMAVLWGTFGDNKVTGCTAKFISKFKAVPHKLEIHFSNESGRSRNRLYAGELLPTLTCSAYSKRLELKDKTIIARVRARAFAIAKFIGAAGNDNTEVLISTGLEDRLSNKAYRILIAELKKTFPSVKFIRNPAGANEKGFDSSGADFIELHSSFATFTGKRPCVVNLDGQSIDDSNSGRTDNFHIPISAVPNFIEHEQHNGCYVFLWGCAAQGDCTGDNSEPHNRSFRINSSDVTTDNRLIRRYEK